MAWAASLGECHRHGTTGDNGRHSPSHVSGVSMLSELAEAGLGTLSRGKRDGAPDFPEASRDSHRKKIRRTFFKVWSKVPPRGSGRSSFPMP